jgi:uncharacterized iron-regulated protein
MLLLATVAAAIFLPRTCGGVERVVRASDGKVITFAQMIEEIRGARVIFIGETHDRPEDHRAQLQIIRALDNAGVPLAIGMEMFTAASQPDLDRWVAGKVAELEFIEIYHRNWEMPWLLYRDILLFARHRRMPLVGLNIPREVAAKVARKGFAALSAEERAKLPAGITCEVDPSYMAFIGRAYAGHTGSRESFLHFCEAQVLWNRSMAQHIVTYLAAEPRRSMVAIIGSGHAMKRGVPEVVGDKSGVKCVVVLSETPGLPSSEFTAEDADYLMLQ